MSRDRVGEFLRERTPRRAIALAVFLGLVVLFRKLLILLVFFVVFERLIGYLSQQLATRARMKPRVALLIVSLLVLGLLGGLLGVGVGRAVHAALAARNTLPERIASIRQTPAFQAMQEHLEDGADKLVENAQHYAGSALRFLSAFGHAMLYALIGFILAVVFRLEHEELEHFWKTIDPRSLRGTIMRWFGYAAEAMLVTVQFQMVVAACNAALTLPVLLFVGIPNAISLSVMIFLSGMVPVVGNFVSGAILALLAFQAKGWFGVVLFVVLTFVLHKLESYYLNPRLAARHVKLPGFVLIMSLIIFEHVFGFIGLFISFPFLYVAQRIQKDLPDEPVGLIPAESARLAAAPESPPS